MFKTHKVNFKSWLFYFWLENQNKASRNNRILIETFWETLVYNLVEVVPLSELMAGDKTTYLSRT